MPEEPDPRGSLVGVTLGHYRVTERIGAGGMGVVYRADDLRLDRVVAVKALPQVAGSEPGARKQLMEEARRASRVASPYVATVFDVVEQEDQAYIVMEYIEGRRLDVMLREDRPGEAAVLALALEIAEALVAIHAAGLVHRDLKPGNVMVAPSGHVKVMDFGLAREDAGALLRQASSDASLSTRSIPGAIAGTIAYMSPEQVRGERLDVRSDLFSFGILLHEAIAGRHPFARGSMLATASAILSEPPSRGVDPPKLATSPARAIVQRLLEKDRERRFPSAETVVAELRGALAGNAPRPGPAPAVPRRRFPRLAVAAVTILAVAATYLIWRSRAQPEPTAPRPAVVVLPFEDRTGDPTRSDLLMDLLSADLSDSSLVRALPSERVRELFSLFDRSAPRSRVREAVAKAAEARWVVDGTLFKDGESYYASIAVFEPGAAGSLPPITAAAGSTAAVAARAGAQIREMLFPGRKDASRTTGTGAFGRSTSEAAQLLDQEAKRALREVRYGDAIEQLKDSLRLDSGFLAAQIRLADALDGAGYGAQAREAADRALQTVDRGGQAARDGPEALEARATHARIHGDADREIAARRALVSLHGDDPAVQLALALALLQRGRLSEALPVADLAIALDPRDPSSYLAKARVLSQGRRAGEASVELDRADALFAEVGSSVGRAKVLRARADSDYAAGLYAQAAEKYQAAARAFAGAGLDVLAARSRKGAGDCATTLGDLDDAARIYEPVLALARSVGDHRTILNVLDSLGAQFVLRGAFDQAEHAFREAIGESSELGNPRLQLGPTFNLASLLAQTGRLSESRTLAEEALAMARDVDDAEIQSKALQLLANLAFHDGQLNQAIRGYREILDSDHLAKAQRTSLGSVHAGLAEFLRLAGMPKQALDSADQAVSLNRTAGAPMYLGYALVGRAVVRADLRLDAEAELDLDEAAKLASERGVSIEELRMVVESGRATLAARRSRWSDAERLLGPLRKESGGTSAEEFDAQIFDLSAEVAIEQGRWRDALRYARMVVEDDGSAAADRTSARVHLARARAEVGERATAESEARRGLDEAGRIGLPLVESLACAILAELPEVNDTEALRERGRAAVGRYLAAVPAERQVAVRARGDLQYLNRVLAKRSRPNELRGETRSASERKEPG